MIEKGTSGRSDSSGDRSLQRLFEHAKPRERPPKEDERELREALYREWDRAMTRRLRLKRGAWMALAASLVVVIGGLSIFVRPGFLVNEASPVALVHRVDGEIRVLDTNRGRSQVAVSTGSELLEGYAVTTEAGQASFDFLEGGSARLSTQTTIELLSGSEVELVRGALYFDSQSMTRPSDRFLVRTSAGTVRHVGTQFVARQIRGAVEVSVREGRVALERASGPISVAAGESVRVPANGGNVQRRKLALHGDEWDWVDRMIPAFDIDGSTLLDYLIWIAREMGYELEFETPEAEQLARATILHGSINMEPLPMLSAVMATTDLEHGLVDGVLYISLP